MFLASERGGDVAKQKVCNLPLDLAGCRLCCCFLFVVFCLFVVFGRDAFGVLAVVKQGIETVGFK